MGINGYRNLPLELRDSGQQRRTNRVWRPMKYARIKVQLGYRNPQAHKGQVRIVSPNRLQLQFNPASPDGVAWITEKSTSVPKMAVSCCVCWAMLTQNYQLVNAMRSWQRILSWAHCWWMYSGVIPKKRCWLSVNKPWMTVAPEIIRPGGVYAPLQ